MYCKCTEARFSDQNHSHKRTRPTSKRLKELSEDPLVAETPDSALLYSITPNPLYFKRNHFQIPDLTVEDLDEWNITLETDESKVSQVSIKALRSLPSTTISVTTECAGNNRLELSPPVSGNQFECGAVSSAFWKGVPLSILLARMNLGSDVKEILFEGTDEGKPEVVEESQPYRRSLPIDVASHPDTILAYEMNGEPLPIEHGAPVRLIVPGWYGMASVKWVRRIAALKSEFEGYFQTYKYVARFLDGSSRLITRMKVKSMITSPAQRHNTAYETIRLTGFAWSGESRIKKVEISTDSGYTWKLANLSDSNSRYLWTQWDFDWDEPSEGHHTIVCRATDHLGNLQPMESRWNELGYEVNSANAICLDVR